MPWNPFSRKTAEDLPDPLGLIVRRAAARIGARVHAYTPEAVVLDFHGKRKTAGLGNIGPRVMGMPEPDRGPAMEFFLKTVFEIREDAEPLPLDAVRGRLVPRVGKPFGPIENPPASIPLIPGQLEINLVLDNDNTVAYVHQNHLSQWNTKIEDLYPQALENLRKRSSPSAWQTFPQAPGVLFYIANDSYDASRLLILQDIVSPWPAGGVLAAVPFRDMLACVRLDGIPALKLSEKMIPIVKGAYDTEGYTISDQLFWTDGDTWDAVPVEYAKQGVHIKVTERLQRAIESLSGDGKKRTL